MRLTLHSHVLLFNAACQCQQINALTVLTYDFTLHKNSLSSFDYQHSYLFKR